MASAWRRPCAFERSFSGAGEDVADNDLTSGLSESKLGLTRIRLIDRGRACEVTAPCGDAVSSLDFVSAFDLGLTVSLHDGGWPCESLCPSHEHPDDSSATCERLALRRLLHPGVAKGLPVYE